MASGHARVNTKKLNLWYRKNRESQGLVSVTMTRSFERSRLLAQSLASHKEEWFGECEK
jgi:hypothetical protein